MRNPDSFAIPFFPHAPGALAEDDKIVAAILGESVRIYHGLNEHERLIAEGQVEYLLASVASDQFTMLSVRWRMYVNRHAPKILPTLHYDHSRDRAWDAFEEFIQDHETAPRDSNVLQITPFEVRGVRNRIRDEPRLHSFRDPAHASFLPKRSRRLGGLQLSQAQCAEGAGVEEDSKVIQYPDDLNVPLCPDWLATGGKNLDRPDDPQVGTARRSSRPMARPASAVEANSANESDGDEDDPGTGSESDADEDDPGTGSESDADEDDPDAADVTMIVARSSGRALADFEASASTSTSVSPAPRSPTRTHRPTAPHSAPLAPLSIRPSRVSSPGTFDDPIVVDDLDEPIVHPPRKRRRDSPVRPSSSPATTDVPISALVESAQASTQRPPGQQPSLFAPRLSSRDTSGESGSSIAGGSGSVNDALQSVSSLAQPPWVISTSLTGPPAATLPYSDAVRAEARRVWIGVLGSMNDILAGLDYLQALAARDMVLSGQALGVPVGAQSNPPTLVGLGDSVNSLSEVPGRAIELANLIRNFFAPPGAVGTDIPMDVESAPRDS